jgi:predicted site-specific integrase-resolvase
MSLVKTWYAPAAAAEKFGVSTAQLLEWVAEGLVRAEQDGDKVSLVNIDDVRLEVEAMVNRSS